MFGINVVLFKKIIAVQFLVLQGLEVFNSFRNMFQYCKLLLFI